MGPPGGGTGLRDRSWKRSKTEVGAPDWNGLRARWGGQGGQGGRIGSRANLIKGLEGLRGIGPVGAWGRRVMTPCWFQLSWRLSAKCLKDLWWWRWVRLLPPPLLVVKCLDLAFERVWWWRWVRGLLPPLVVASLDLCLCPCLWAVGISDCGGIRGSGAFPLSSRLLVDPSPLARVMRPILAARERLWNIFANLCFCVNLVD